MLKAIEKYAEKQNVPVDLIYLLILGGFYAIGIFLSNTFVNVFLWKQSQSYLTIALFHLASAIFQLVAFIYAGKKTKDWNHVIVLRAGIITLALFFLTVYLMDEQAATYAFLLGCLIGIGYGFYWLAFNVLTFEITEPETRDFFNGWLGILESLGGMAGPLIAGYIISKFVNSTGYMIVFASSFFFFILAIATSILIHPRKAEGSYNLLEVFRERKNNPNWNALLNAHFFEGLREGVFFFIVTLWVFTVSKSEFILGIFNLSLAGISLLSYSVITRLNKTITRKKQLFIGSLILYLAIFLIIKPDGILFVFIYAFVIGLSFPIFEIPYISLTFDVIGQLREIKRLRVEYIVMREVFLNFGRVISILFFLIFIMVFSEEFAIPLTLLIFGTGHFFVYRMIRYVHVKKQNSHPEDYLNPNMIFNEKNH